MSDGNPDRKLHPRLRVVKNGGGAVNEMRSDLTLTVACTAPAYAGDAEAADGLEAAPVRPGLEMSVVTQALAAQSPAAAEPLPERPKRHEVRPAGDAYVNVFIEVFPEQAQTEEPGTETDVPALVEELQRRIAEVDHAQIRAAVVQRRNFISATVPVTALEELSARREIAFVHPSEPLKLDVPNPAPASEPTLRTVPHTEMHRDGEGVLIGIIDVGGFDFAHEDFLDGEGKTRFVSIWDQGGDFRPPPAGFGYGAEFTRDQLNAAIEAAREPGMPPAVWIEPQSQRQESSHGTHVASIAAGKSGVCPRALIAGVLIDVPMPGDEVKRRRATFSDTSRITHAVEYLLKVARKHRLPVSINISLGTNGGAHDGSSGVSRWLDAYLAAPGRAITVAAGNAGQEAAESEHDLGWIMGRIHTSGRIPARGLEVELEWTVVGNGLVDVSENELEIWYGASDRFTVALLPPGSQEWIEVESGEFVENRRLADGTTVSVYNELYHPTNGHNYIALYLSPNLDPRAFRGIRSGTWRVRLRGEDVRDGHFHAWIERDDPMEIGGEPGRRLFRFPSFFSQKTNVDSHSISSVACGHRVIAAANLDDTRQRIHASSSQGPTRDGRCKPEIAAPGSDIVAANGFGDPSEPWVAMTGTSMAAPYVTGVVGLMLTARPELTAAQCTGILQRTARPLPGLSYDWGNDVGYGRIDAAAAVQEAVTINERHEKRRGVHA